MIKAGTNLEQYDSQGNTVLIKSTQMRDVVLVEMLLKAGAKPFGHIKDKPKETAFLKIHKDDTEIQRLFDEKVSEFKSKIANSLAQSRFDDTLTLIQENNIPFSLPMATLPLETYIFPFISKPTDRAENLIKYFVDGRSFEKLDVLKNQSLLVGASNALENSEFFSYLIDKLTVEKSKIPKTGFENESNGINVQELGLKGQFTKPQWLAKQLEVIAVKNNVIVDFSFMNEVSKDAIKFSISEELSVTKVVAGFLKQSFPDSHKNSFTEDILNLIYGSTEVVKKSILIKAVLEIWKNQSISKSGYSLDQHTSKILNTTKTEGLDAKTYSEIVELLLIYTSDRESTETISTLMALSLPMNVKADLISFTLNYSKKIPKGAFAAAVKTSNLSVLSLLTESGAPFDPSEQTDAILIAINESKTGPVAQSFLISLKQSGLNFNNNAGADALLSAVMKVTGNNDSSYLEVVEFLISLSDHPLNALNDEERSKVIYEFLKYSIKNNTTWNTLNKVLLKSDILTGSFVYTEKFKVSKNDPQELNISVPWYLILHLFENKNSNAVVGNLIPILKQVLRVYQNSDFSVSVVEERATVNSTLFPTQQILPLSILLWAGKDNISQALSDSYAKESSFGISIGPVSYVDFSVSPVFSYLSSDKDFWGNIITELLKTESMKVLGSNPISIYNLMKISTKSGAIENFKELSTIFNQYEKPILSSDAECRLEGVSDDEIKNWSTIGSFVTLESLYQKSCSGAILSQNEADFFKSFAAQHIENDVEEIFVNQSADACEPYNFVATNGGFYGVEFSRGGYSEMGALLLKGKDEGSDLITDIIANPDLLYFGKKCKTSNYTPEIHLQAKLQFLKDWNNCVLNNQDTSMINSMQNLDSKYGFSKMNGTVKICK